MHVHGPSARLLEGNSMPQGVKGYYQWLVLAELDMLEVWSANQFMPDDMDDLRPDSVSTKVPPSRPAPPTQVHTSPRCPLRARGICQGKLQRRSRCISPRAQPARCYSPEVLCPRGASQVAFQACMRTASHVGHMLQIHEHLEAMARGDGNEAAEEGRHDHRHRSGKRHKAGHGGGGGGSSLVRSGLLSMICASRRFRRLPEQIILGAGTE